MNKDSEQFLSVRVNPDEMIQFVLQLITMPPDGAASDTATPVARAARLRWNALNRALTDPRVGMWTSAQKRSHVHIPAVLIAAAGVARLTMSGDEVVFDIPTLLDASLLLCEPAGNA